MRDPLELSGAELLDSLADPEDPIASSVLAAQTIAAAAAILTMVARASSASEGSGLAAQAESVRARASALVVTCAQAFAEASSRLRARPRDASVAADTERDFLLGRALHRAAEGPAAAAEAAGDVGLLALALADGCDPDRLPDVRAACSLAEGAARGCAGLVAINLVAGSDEDLVSKAQRGAELVAEAGAQLSARQ